MAKKSFQYETIEDFADKKDYEGGIYSFASYGCDASEIKDKKLSKLWAEFMIHFKNTDRVSQEILDYIENYERSE